MSTLLRVWLLAVVMLGGVRSVFFPPWDLLSRVDDVLLNILARFVHCPTGSVTATLP